MSSPSSLDSSPLSKSSTRKNTKKDAPKWLAKATVEDAITHGLTDTEFRHITDVLGRPINVLEVGICAALFSEHCSYKSTKVHLRGLPTEGKRVLQGPGENAGVIDIGDGEAVVFKVESHNHPTFIEPYQGAATGVGGDSPRCVHDGSKTACTDELASVWRSFS